MQAAQDKGQVPEAWAGPSSSPSPVPAGRLTPPSGELSTRLLPAVCRAGAEGCGAEGPAVGRPVGCGGKGQR